MKHSRLWLQALTIAGGALLLTACTTHSPSPQLRSDEVGALVTPFFDRIVTYQARLHALAEWDEADHFARGVHVVMSAIRSDKPAILRIGPLKDAYVYRLPTDNMTEEPLCQYCVGYNIRKLYRADQLYCEGKKEDALVWVKAVKEFCSPLIRDCDQRIGDITQNLAISAYREKYSSNREWAPWVQSLRQIDEELRKEQNSANHGVVRTGDARTVRQSAHP